MTAIRPPSIQSRLNFAIEAPRARAATSHPISRYAQPLGEGLTRAPDYLVHAGGAWWAVSEKNFEKASGTLWSNGGFAVFEKTKGGSKGGDFQFEYTNTRSGNGEDAKASRFVLRRSADKLAIFQPENAPKLPAGASTWERRDEDLYVPSK